MRRYASHVRYMILIVIAQGGLNPSIAQTLVHFQYHAAGQSSPVGGLLISDAGATLEVFDFRLVCPRLVDKQHARLLKNPATELEVAARIGIAPVASWSISQEILEHSDRGQVIAVEMPFASIDLGTDHSVAKGDAFDVLRRPVEPAGPTSRALIGPEFSTLGRAEVVEVQPNTSRIRLPPATSDLKVGDVVRPIRRARLVAVLPFVDDTGTAVRGGLQLSEELTSYLSKYEVPLVERTLLGKATEELKLAHGNRFTDKERLKIGRMLGASILVVGTIQGSDSKANVNIRLVETETGEVLYAGTFIGKKLDFTPTSQSESGRSKPLVDLKPFDVVRGPVTFHSGHDGQNIWMHPPTHDEGQGYARAKYRTNGRYRSLRFSGNLLATRSGRTIKDPIVFTILADGKPLWTSGPVKAQPSIATDEVDIKGAHVLEFRVESLGDATGAHARWDDVMLVE